MARAEVEAIDRADTLGAGDAFAGAFLFALSRGTELAEALRTSCQAATDALTRER